MNITIEAITYALPERVVSNESLAADYPDWDFARLEERTGVYARHIAAPGETALDLALVACRRLVEAGHSVVDSDAIIFCTETPDYPIPPNSNLLHGHLDMDRNVTAFDITAGCSGYIYGLELARGLISAGSARRVLLATGDTYSTFINPGDRAARCLFGDGAAVSIITPATDDEGVIDISLGSSGKEYDRFIVPAGGARSPRSNDSAIEIQDRSGNIRSPENIAMDGFGVLSFFNNLVPRETNALLADNGLEIDDIDLFVFHQASAIALDTLQRVLKIPDAKMAREFSDTGNLVSASVPVTLKRCQEKGLAGPGSLVLLSGFGVGLSWGTALMKIPTAA